MSTLVNMHAWRMNGECAEGISEDGGGAGRGETDGKSGSSMIVST